MHIRRITICRIQSYRFLMSLFHISEYSNSRSLDFIFSSKNPKFYFKIMKICMKVKLVRKFASKRLISLLRLGYSIVITHSTKNALWTSYLNFAKIMLYFQTSSLLKGSVNQKLDLWIKQLNLFIKYPRAVIKFKITNGFFNSIF